jgi:hypothetical protein
VFLETSFYESDLEDMAGYGIAIFNKIFMNIFGVS